VPKIPKYSGASPAEAKQPRLETGAARTGRPVWRVGRTDFNGPWCPKRMAQANLVDILEKLKLFENSTWPDIERGGSHFITVNRVIKEAQERLRILRLDDTDELFSLRLSGTERLWGLRYNDVFSLLWWDPDHEICPALKKHT
jgi:hypothetical protein